MNSNAQEQLPEFGYAQPADSAGRHVGEGAFKGLLVAIGSCLAVICLLSLGSFLNQVFGRGETTALVERMATPRAGMKTIAPETPLVIERITPDQ